MSLRLKTPGYLLNLVSERQKVLRKVKQAKKKLSSTPQNEKKALESSLFDARVDLNYILVC